MQIAVLCGAVGLAAERCGPAVAHSRESTVWMILSEVTTAVRTLSNAFGEATEPPTSAGGQCAAYTQYTQAGCRGAAIARRRAGG
jgi:hypothetical protein